MRLGSRGARWQAWRHHALASLLVVGVLPLSVQPGGSRTATVPAAASLAVTRPAAPQIRASDHPVLMDVLSQPPAPGDPPAAAPVDPGDDTPPAPVPDPTPAPDPCSEALAWVAAAGLPLPAGVGYQCPSTQFPHQGAACWDGGPCAGTAFVAINMDRLAGTSTPTSTTWSPTRCATSSTSRPPARRQSGGRTRAPPPTAPLPLRDVEPSCATLMAPAMPLGRW